MSSRRSTRGGGGKSAGSRSLRKARLSATGHLRGEFAISEAALLASERLLPTFRGPDGDHEGILYLLGRELDELTFYTTVLAPEADHGYGHVICEPPAIATAQRSAREHGLAILGQLHSHPSDLTEHSEGDDDLVLMPFEGMLSLVAPWYGRVGLQPLAGLGVHQFQDGRWQLIDPRSVSAHFHVLPTGIDLR